MYVKNQREAADLSSLADSIAQRSPTGSTAMHLMLRSGLDLGRIHKLLAKHNDYFVRVGSTSRYTLNRFGKYKGVLDRIQEDIQAQLAATEKRRRLIGIWLFLLFVFLILGRN
jgi:hypothetical protein